MNTTRRLLRVVVADDSPVVQQLLRELIDSQPDMLVVGTAASGRETIEKVERLRPDLVTMDVDMPDGDGLSAAQRIMSHRPTPIAVVTAAPIGPSSSVTFDALASGAVEVLQKPGRTILDSAGERESFTRRLRRVAEVGTFGVRGMRASFEPGPANAAAAETHLHRVPADAAVIAIGASIGGPPCIRTIVSGLDPARAPALVVVQHMTREFIPAFVAWLRDNAPLPVVLAADGTMAEPGRVYVASGDRHLTLDAQGVLREDAGPPRHGQRPAVDVLFESLAEHRGARALGVLLTGMGEDGARGLRAMREAGAFTIAQDAGSCVVSSMPAAASRLDAAVVTANPSGIAWLLRRVNAAPWSVQPAASP